MANASKKTAIIYKGHRAVRGERMTKGPWRLMQAKNKKVFVGSLIDTINIGGKRIALFSVPK